MYGQKLGYSLGQSARHRILHVFRTPVGGLFRHVLDVARLQAAAGHEVGLFCDSSSGGARAEAALAALAPELALGITRAPMRRAPHPLDAVVVARLARLVRERRPSVLHGHGSKGGAFARLVPSAEGAVRAYTPHGGSFHYGPGTRLHRFYMAAERAMIPRTDVFLFESAYAADRFRAYLGETDRVVRVVHNGVAEHEFEPVAHVPDPFDFVFVGELRDLKGIHVLIEALARMRERGLRRTLLVVGSGPDERALHALARARGVWDSVAFVPPGPIRAALARGRVMVVPSLAESLPYVVLEAAAAGQPLVATRAGGVPEIFGPASGALVAPGDVDALICALLAKRDEPEAARRTAVEALRRTVAERFSLRGMGEGVLAGYAAALAARRATAAPAAGIAVARR